MSKLDFSPAYLNKIQQLQIRLRRSSLGSQSGVHQSVKKGHGLEFSDLRPYSPGDDFRSVDWNALARTDKLYTRQYREEQDVNVLVVEDFSLSLAKNTIAQMISLSLCYVALSSGDKVSLLLPSIDQFPWVRSIKNFRRMIEFVESKTPSRETNLSMSIMEAASKIRLPARVYVVSDFMFPIEDLEKTLEYCKGRNFDLSLVIVDNFEESIFVEDATLVDSETNKEFNIDASIKDLRFAIDGHFSKIIELARYYGQQFVVVRHDENIEQLVLNKFIEAGLLR